MQHRRPHSNVANGNGHDSSREDRRLERRLAKERRGVKKVRRVKRSMKYGTSSKLSSPWEWKSDPHFQMAFFSFGLFSLVGTTMFRMFHHGDGGGLGRHQHFNKGNGNHKKYQHSSKEGEYNSDNAGGNLLSKLRGGNHYVIPDSMKKVGEKHSWYAQLREEFDTETLPKDDERSLKFVEAERERKGIYEQSPDALTPYDIYNCPDHPHEDYPIQWPVLDVLRNWPSDDANPQAHREIYQGLCVFDYRTDLQKAKHYRHREVPFVMRNDPAAARTAERWNYPGYMERLLMGDEDQQRRTEYSPNNHFMYWVDKRTRSERRRVNREFKELKRDNDDVHNGFGRGDQLEMKEAMHQQQELNRLKEQVKEAREYAEEHEDDDEAQEEFTRLNEALKAARHMKQRAVSEHWQPPTENLRMTYLEWLEHANVTDDMLGPDNPHWYFRLIGCGHIGDHTEDGSCDAGSSEWLFDELTFFQPREGERRPFYLIEPKSQKGIHCRFGMKGVIAENHFDLSRNAIALLGGQRRYILAHPNQCELMNLLPKGHPSARHSAVDWSNPDLENFPSFERAHVNEIVMQPGDVLYLPTNWFHYIISLELNMQCNTRSGGEKIYREEINECGF